ncbi:DNA-packaging protein [Parasphingopyxis algicola]|uniref:DNA-packaging protein n=1 Tax=Parasphingopyxis algicola TaxID=2026624 RepID=UPI0015A19210|nr:terminase family protein [Parasphingopyxis algicola]QLC23647.1 DNA-packaging protein [Parasphingopyxis algicola]
MGRLNRRLEALLSLPQTERRALLEELGQARARRLRSAWRVWAGDDQKPPPGDWRIWLILAGRGFGKTRAGAEWVRGIAKNDGAARIALVGASLFEARSVMVEGESGVLAATPGGEDILWEPSLRRLAWPSGARATLYSAAEPESLRGPQHSHAWCDEIGKWSSGEAAWDNLMLGLRLGADPRTVATTTPRPVALVRRLFGDAESGKGGTVLTRGRTQDNRAHLAPGFIVAIEAAYGGTRLGRQELDGELIEDIEGGLWPRGLIEACRVRNVPALRRVVVAVDPPAGAGPGSDACGVVVAGLGEDGRGYVLADASAEGLRPEGWAAKVADTAAAWDADRVVAEANQGGAMVRSVLQAAGRILPLRLIHASRGKSARAEPVAALYETGRVGHAGTFPALEDEMAGMTIGGGYEGPGRSPDRADALVYALTELMLGRAVDPGVRKL